MRSSEEIRKILSRINNKGYKAYRDLRGDYDCGWFSLHVDLVQGDPFAAPSRLRIRIPMETAQFPEELAAPGTRRRALADFLARRVQRVLTLLPKKAGGSGKSGLLAIDAGGQEVLDRTACRVTPEWVEARIYAGLPASGRRVLGAAAQEMLCDQLPRMAEQGLLWQRTPQQEAQAFVACVENQEHIRSELGVRGLVAFVGDGAILPRESGNSQRPLAAEKAVHFQSPDTMRVTFDLPNPLNAHSPEICSISGMGIPEGITLIVGGGYHGKSTLLQALERGVYPHVPADGREYVVTRPDAVKIRAEDGRRIEEVDITPFIESLPSGADTASFSTDNGSGSTSQAANILEALETGASALLLDEDTSATNFMVRDARMQALVHKDNEPITPFIERIREIYERFSVSTVLVMGGCGDYFDVADTVVLMRDYTPHEVSAQAREVAAACPTGRRNERKSETRWRLSRTPRPETFDPSRGRKRVKIDARSLDQVIYGTEAIDLKAVEQLVDISQTRALGPAIHLAVVRFMDRHAPLRSVLDKLDHFLDENGLDPLDPFHRPGRHPGSFARPRRHEIAAAINRLRSARLRQPS